MLFTVKTDMTIDDMLRIPELLCGELAGPHVLFARNPAPPA